MYSFRIAALLALVHLVASDETRELSEKYSYRASKHARFPVQLGPRPYYLIQSMAPSPLKDKLTKCANEKRRFDKKDWSIAHRGSCLMFPEHTLLAYEMGLRMGAGVNECDVTFTKDKELICRHDQCDLHTSTDVLLRPELAAKCTKDWPGPKCCTSDFTLAEIKTLCAKMDAASSSATTREGYVSGGVAAWRTTLYQNECPRVPTHKEYIELIKKFGAKFTPELKTPSGVVMPYNGFSQSDYAQKMIDEYVAAGVHPSNVYPQSFLWSDTIYWVQNTEYKNAVALEGTYDVYYWSKDKIKAWFQSIVDAGVPIIAPPMWMLAKLGANNTLAISDYATVAKEMGLDIITWSLDRDGPLQKGGGFYFTGLSTIVNRDGFTYNFLEFLRTDVDILGIFSDWPATVTFFANCMDL